MQENEQHETITFPCSSQEFYYFFPKTPNNEKIPAMYTYMKDIDGAHIPKCILRYIIYYFMLYT